MSDQNANELMLSGLDGGNSLAFLAALGTFRVVNQLKPVTECRMKWTEHAGAWRPVLVFGHVAEEQSTFVEKLDLKLKSMVDHPAFQLGDNLNVPPEVFREYARKSLRYADTIDAEVDTRVWAILRRLLDTETTGFVHPSQPGHHPLTRPTLGTVRLDQRPIGVPLAVLCPKALANKHGQMLATKIDWPRRKVVTTSRFQTTQLDPRPSTNDLRQKTDRKYFEIVDFSL